MNTEEYHKLAAVEDRMWYFRALHAHIESALVRATAGRPARILDAGCGTGGLILRLANRHPDWTWTGLDASHLACALARERLAPVGQASVVEGKVEQLPFENGAFTTVVSADVLYHVDDDAAALREFHRVLAPGGTLIVNVPALPWLWSYHDIAVHGRRRYYRRQVLAELAVAGFAERTATYWNTLPFPLVVVRRKLLPAPRDGSDVHVFPAPIEAAFDAAMAVERAGLRLLGGLPIGSSVFAVATKR